MAHQTLGLLSLSEMESPQRLAALRTQKGLTQDALSEATGIHVVQIHCYETGKSQPTFDVLRKLAVGLSVSADLLLFDKDERGPDDDLRLQFEATRRLGPEQKQVIREVIEGIVLRHEVKRLATTPSG